MQNREKKENKVAAVVVTYNRKELLKQCIERLLSQEEKSCDVLIIDNASTDGTAEMVREEYPFPQLIYWNMSTNLGGAGGFQFGVKKAVERGYEYVWIMDDDTLPEKDALKELFEADRKLKGSWGFLSSVAYWTDGNICRMNIQKKTIFKHIGKNEYESEYAPIVMCSFVSLLVKADVVREVGLPIGDYFIWTDDYEYTGRISRKYPCYMVSGSKVVHAMKKHTRVNFATDDPTRISRYQYIYRNDVHCYRQYGVKGWMYIVLKDIYSVVNVLFNAKENKLERIGIIMKGFMKGLTFTPQIEQVSDSGGNYSSLKNCF